MNTIETEADVLAICAKGYGCGVGVEGGRKEGYRMA